MRKHGVERRPWRSPTRKVVFTLTFARERKVFTQKIVQRSARAMSPMATFETSRMTLRMSAYRGRPEVSGVRSK